MRAMDRTDYALISIDLAEGETAGEARVMRLLEDAERDGDYRASRSSSPTPRPSTSSTAARRRPANGSLAPVAWPM